MRFIAIGLAAFLAVIFCGWYSGLDMLTRGAGQGTVFALALAAGVCAGAVSAMVWDINRMTKGIR